MATLNTASISPWAPRVAKVVTQTLGATILAVTAWSAAVLLTSLPQKGGTLSYWLFLGVNLPLWLPCWIGGFALLRRRPSGFWYLYIAVALLVASEVACLCPSLYRVLGQARYGGVTHSWPVVLTLLIVPVLAHCLSVHFDSSQPASAGRRWYGWLSLAVVLAQLYFGCSVGRQRLEQEAGAVLWQGYAADTKGRHEEARGKWGWVIERYPYTSAQAEAVIAAGSDLEKQHLYDKAIACFQSVLEADAIRADPISNLLGRQGYQYAACVEISSCYEAVGDYPSALRYAILARDKYNCERAFGTCTMGLHQQLQDRIERLEEKVRGGQ